MLLESLETAAVQTTPAILLVWAASRFLSPKVQVWLWRLVFLRLTVGLFLWPSVDLPVLSPEPATLTSSVGAPIATPEPFPTWQLLWILGVVALCAVALRESWQARRLVHRAISRPGRVSDSNLRSNCRISDQAKVPMVVGMFRPVILIPREISENASPSELRMIVAHEEGHIAHRDLLWGWLIWTGRAAFFFHPLVWLASRCERFAREAAADRFAIEKSGADPHGYGQVLLRIALADPLRPTFSPAGLSMSDSYKFVYRRLESMKNHSQRLTLRRVMSTGALCAITFGLLPAFNFVPAAAQSPMDSATEPVVYPSSEIDQAVNVQSPTYVQQTKTQAVKRSAKRTGSRVRTNLSPRKPLSNAPLLLRL